MDKKNIKLCFFDLDGTLTDGRYNVSSDGILMKSFHTRDFRGLSMLQSMNVSVYIITSAIDPTIKYKINSLPEKSKKFLCLLSDIEDKKKEIESLLSGTNIGWENIAYMGDDVNDLECMKLAAWTGCPADAVDEIKEEANCICTKNGGYGAVREFVEDLMSNEMIVLDDK